VELGTEISAPYCTKLLVDLGAEVYKIETPEGDPLRRWGPFPDGVPDPQRSGLFEYLNAGKRGATIDPACRADIDGLRDLIAGADALVENIPTRTPALGKWGLDADTLGRVNSRLVAVRISDFGQHGPLRVRNTTPLTMQAAAGWVNLRDQDRPPVQAGGRIPEYIAGGYAALGCLTALRCAEASERLVEVDVSVFEAMLSTLPYPMMMAERLKGLGLPTNVKAAPMLGIVHAADGWIGVNCLTGQHWLDLCALLGLPEFEEHQLAIMLGGPERDEFFAKAQPWFDEQKVAELVELSQAMRIPAAPVSDGASIIECPQFVDRGFIIESSSHGWGFRRPGPPFRLAATPCGNPRPAPRLGADLKGPRWAPTARVPRTTVADVTLPFAGLKVFDLSTFWAGAYLTCYLGAFGADVVKVESIQRPDGHRFSGALLRDGDDWYERGPLWQGTNANKRDITLDLSTAEGRGLALRLAAQADVVVENFSPRVVEHFGLDYDTLAELNPGIIMVRMPGFGLSGPWRDYVGWALNFEQLSGMAAVTGYPDGPPCNLQGPADPVAGVHAAVALLAALEHRNRCGEGQLIEVAQVEVCAAVTAEPIIAYSCTGNVPGRLGNREQRYVQGVYPTANEGDWVAISVRDDSDWAALADAIGLPGLLDDARFVGTNQRLGHHNDFDELVSEWSSARSPDAVVEALQASGVPVEPLMTPDRMYDIEQLAVRGYYEELDHPVSGRQRFPGWPFRITPGPRHQHRKPPPLIGQHNDEVLGGVGVSNDELDVLKSRNIIGNRILNS
jgi:crotonobetainyl-CoA:carnitine CoA-transferase CaiB-like acyl-CoA transferase